MRIDRLGWDRTDLQVAVLFEFGPHEVPSASPSPQEDAADIAYLLANSGVDVITPHNWPDRNCAEHWIFPDTDVGIQAALTAGADVIWAHTPLLPDHPLFNFRGDHWILGQRPEDAEAFGNKWEAVTALRRAGCSMPRSILISSDSVAGSFSPGALTDAFLGRKGFEFPLVVKPVRGRHSTGVTLATNIAELRSQVVELLHQNVCELNYWSNGKARCVVIEEYIDGPEFSVGVFPPGRYQIAAETRLMSDYWATVPIATPSALEIREPLRSRVGLETMCDANADALEELSKECVRAARAIGATAPIRIDARVPLAGHATLIDVNLKPRLGAVGRSTERSTNSLLAQGLKASGLLYQDIIVSLLAQAWQCRSSASHPETYYDARM